MKKVLTFLLAIILIFLPSELIFCEDDLKESSTKV